MNATYETANPKDIGMRNKKRGGKLVRVTLAGHRGPQPCVLVEEDRPPSPAGKSEQQGEMTTASPPSTTEKGKNDKKRKLNWHPKCLQAAGMEVRFPEER